MFVFEQESVCSAGETRARCARAGEEPRPRAREQRVCVRCEMLRWGELSALCIILSERVEMCMRRFRS